jgi:hypothetical protein
MSENYFACSSHGASETGRPRLVFLFFFVDHVVSLFLCRIAATEAPIAPTVKCQVFVFDGASWVARDTGLSNVAVYYNSSTNGYRVIAIDGQTNAVCAAVDLLRALLCREPPRPRGGHLVCAIFFSCLLAFVAPAHRWPRPRWRRCCKRICILLHLAFCHVAVRATARIGALGRVRVRFQSTLRPAGGHRQASTV